MRTKIFSVVCFAFLTMSSAVWGMQMDMDMENNSAVSEQTISASGTVKSIASDRKSVRIFHNPIAALSWPAMNMPFEIADHELVSSLQVGDKVNFEFVQKEGKNVIIKISK